MNPRLRGALRGAAARVIGSRFAKPIARAAVVGVGLIGLAVIGRVATAGSVPVGGDVALASPATSAAAPAVLPGDVAGAASPGSARPPAVPSASTASTVASTHVSSRSAASGDDPVFLNVAGLDDLRRLPGIGPKRAEAILALRTRMGRFRAVEDLLKVKGLGRAALKRLRPLVRLDPPPAGAALDGGGGSSTPPR